MSIEGVDVVNTEDQDGQALVPKLRFPEFRDAGAWPFKPLHSMAKRKARRNTDEQIIRVLTNSAEHGVVDQKDYFDKDIAVQGNLDSYFVVDEGDFVYNPRISSLAPVGPIGKNKVGTGVMSPLYTVFGFEGENDIFYEHFFRSALWHGYMRLVSNSGARHDRIAISNRDFMAMPVPTPCPGEQQKVADCLSSLDALIAAEGDRLSALRDYKKGLMQQLFPRPERIENGRKIPAETTPRLRFPEFRDAGEWKETSLRAIGELVSGLTYSPSDVRDSGLLVLRSSNIQGGKIDLSDCVYVNPNVRGANEVKPGDILICVRNGSTSLIGKNALIPDTMPLCTHGAFMTIFRTQAAKFVFQLFQTSTYQRQVAADLGATINSINGTQLLRYQFYIPGGAEQRRISEFLSAIDERIASQSDKLESLKAHKSGLMQQLFPSHSAATA